MLAFSSLWVAAAAAALCTAASVAMGLRPSAWAVGLAAAGTLVVYNVDRLRDLERDRTTSPDRSAFVAAHRTPLLVLVGLAALASAGLALRFGLGGIALLAPVLAVGLLHRRLKRHVWWKPLYVTAAWTVVTVGLPTQTGPARHVVWVAAIVAATVFANVIASNLRDGEAVSVRLGPGAPLFIARSLALLAALCALAAPAGVRALVVLPLVLLATLLRFRADERYGLVVVDGALLVGALVALPLLGA